MLHRLDIDSSPGAPASPAKARSAPARMFVVSDEYLQHRRAGFDFVFLEIGYRSST
jgi:hypothetical protein